MRLLRAAFVAVIAGALASAPAVATAATYPAPVSPLVTTSLQGADASLGNPFTMSIAADDGAEVLLNITHDDAPDDAIQIAGAASLVKIAAGGGATFFVTLHHEGEFILEAHVDGELVATHAITVVEPAGAGGGALTGVTDDAYAAPEADVNNDATARTGSDGDASRTASVINQLPASGTEVAFFGAGALLLLMAGTTWIGAARRRRHHA